MRPLSDLDVLVVDCQATAAYPRGHLIEIGWARARAADVSVQARLVRLPDGVTIPRAVSRITGISDARMRDAVDPSTAWFELLDQARMLTPQPAPAVIHFARFELPFLRSLSDGVPPFEVVCTHDIARRLLPDLPRCSLRALAGYFGRAVGALRRSAEHVDATVFVWRELVQLLDVEGVASWESLRDWLRAPAGRRRNRVWPLPRDVRLSLPDAPGVYRLLRTSGDVLYVGKAMSLHHRVNSYFRKRHGVPERMLEMLSQVRAISFEVTPTALEAALLEPDEIKRHRPPYNLALTDARDVWFATPDLGARSRRATAACPAGPFPSAQVLDQFAALGRSSRVALGSGRGAPEPAVFDAGHALLRAAHRELWDADDDACRRLLRLGTRLWREGRRDCEPVSADAAEAGRQAVWTPEHVQFSLERLALRAALARRRARWLVRLVDSALVWSEPGAAGARLLVIENGDIAVRDAVPFDTAPPVPPGHRRRAVDRKERLTLARFDRLRVLTTELKRLVAEDAPVAVRFGEAPALAGARLARMLAWL